MCGISGIVNKNGFDLHGLKSMTDIVRHRGPDDEGFVLFSKPDSQPLCIGGINTPVESFSSGLLYQPTGFIDSLTSSKFTIGLGHRRLSILDLSPAGHQPMCCLEGNLWITYNGEIYNYLELKEELRQLGHQFISSSDTEVLLNAYKQWGAACLNRFVGMWSFVIYDASKHELFMARDRYGIKPLYYWFSQYGDFCFGSEIKQFTVINGWKARLNGQRAYDYLIYSLTDHTDETMFKGVYHLPGGHYIKLTIEDIFSNSTGKLKTSHWYIVNYKPYKGSLSDACSEFEMHFKKAVQMHLRSDVAIGTALSGGLDSSAIVCEINNLLKSEGKEDIQKTFSSCAIDERYDERKWMDIVVEYTKVNAHFVYPEFENLFKLTPKILWHQDEPYQSQSVYLGYHVFELANKNNVKVLLNGQGADEYLGGYEQFRIARYGKLLKNLKWRPLFNEIRSNKAYSSIQNLKIIFRIIHHFLPASLKKIASKIFGHDKHIRACIDIKKLGANEKHPDNQIPVKYNTVSEISLHLTFYSTLPKFLRWEDRNSMAHSIEARVPFLDHRLVEFSFNLPVEYLDDQGETKKVLRSGLKNLLPLKISSRKDKKGFITPEERWVKEDYTEIFRSMLEKSILELNGIIKAKALTYFDNIADGRLPFDYSYWRFILFAEWVKQFNVEIQNNETRS